MKRYAAVLIAGSLAAALLVPGCQRTVEVQTGTRTVCTAGELVSEDIKTIEVPLKDAVNYRVKTVTITCDTHSGLSKLYSEAQAAIAAGDLATAKDKLAQVVASNPAYRQAKQQLDEINAGKKPAPDTGGGSGGDAGGSSGAGGGSAAPTGSATPTATAPTALTGWIPGTLSGWTAQKPTVDALSVAREYVPSGSSPAINLVIVAEQFSSEADAKKSIDQVVRARYGKDAANLTVNGHAAYFGTDGRSFAVIAFPAGKVMVALEMAAKSGAPKALRPQLEAAARQLP